LLNSNLLKLGAGVSVSVASCGLAIADDTSGMRLPQQVTNSTVRINPFVTPTVGPQTLFTKVSDTSDRVMQTSDLQFSELRLKSIGTAVGLVPIGQPRSMVPVIEISQPPTSTIRVNPMAGGASDLLDQPVINIEDVDTETMPASPGITHNVAENLASEIIPGIESPVISSESLSLSMQVQTLPVESELLQQVAVTEQTETAVAEPETISELIAEVPDNTEYGVSFSFSDQGDGVEDLTEAAPPEEWVIPPPPLDAPSLEIVSVPVSSAASETVDESAEHEIESLPLLPIPHRQWVAQQPTEAVAEKYPQRHRQHVEVATPPMIAAARVSRPGTVSGTPILPAKLARLVEPKKQESAEPVAHEPVAHDPIAELANKIRDLHSTASVSLTEENSRLVVRGVCRSREQATEVIRLIRSRFLIPVDDQLVVR
jgi:hypothetical protein